MKHKITPWNVGVGWILILALLLPMSVVATSYNTISIDGNITGWATDESFAASSSSTAYFTWDADYLYFGIAHGEADYGNMATFMYMDADPQSTPTSGNGTTNGYAWGNNVVLPFNADYVVVWKNSSGNDYIEVKQYNNTTSSWDTYASATSQDLNTNEVNFRIGTDYREVRIKRSIIGSPTAIRVSSFTEQQWGSYWRYFHWPSDAGTDEGRASNHTLNSWYGFPLTTGIAPNNSAYKNGDPTAVDLVAFSAEPQGNAIRVTWETAQELDNLGFNLYRGESAAGPWTRLNAELIPAQNPGATFGATYTWLDEGVTPDATYFYRLEDVNVYGVSTFHGPVSTTAATPSAVRITGFGARGPAFGLPLALAALGLWGLARKRRS